MSNAVGENRIQETSVPKNVLKRLGQGLKDAVQSITVLVIFGIVVVGAGGLGIWITLVTYKAEVVSFKNTLAVAFATYYLAILASLFADLTYDVFQRLVLKRGTGEEKMRPSTQVGLWFSFFGIGSILLTLAIVTLILPAEWENYAFWFGLLGTVAGLVLWLVISGESGKYSEKALDKYYNAEMIVDDKIEGEGVQVDGTTKL